MLDLRVSEKLSKEVLSTLYSWPRYKLGFSASYLESQYLQKCCKYHLKKMFTTVPLASFLLFAYCFSSPDSLEILIRWFIAW